MEITPALLSVINNTLSAKMTETSFTLEDLTISPKLEYSGSNYSSWRSDLKTVLKHLKLWDKVAQKPTLNDHVFTCIKLSVTFGLKTPIDTAAGKEESAILAFDFLEKRFNMSSITHGIEARVVYDRT